MTTTTKILVGLAGVTIFGMVWNNYQKGKGKSFLGKPLADPATTDAKSGVDGFDQATGSIKTANNGVPVYVPTGTEKKYPPGVYVKGLGFTDHQGKII